MGGPNLIKLDLGKFAKPFTVLIRAFRAGVGAAAEPWLIRRIARAQADAAKTKALSDVDVAQIRKQLSAPTAEPVDVQFEVVDEPDIAIELRAEKRVAFLEEKRQKNIEDVVDGAVVELLQDPGKGSSVDVDPDWAARFFDSVKDVSDDEIKQLWTKLLASEVRARQFSLRTIDALKNISAEEAHTFAKIAPYVATTIGGILLPDAFYRASGLNFGVMTGLRDAGLLSDLNVTYDLSKAPPDAPIYWAIGDVALVGKSTGQRFGKLPSLLATDSGIELARLLRGMPDVDYLKQVLQRVREANYDAAIHRVTRVIGTSYDYEDEPMVLEGDVGNGG